MFKKLLRKLCLTVLSFVLVVGLGGYALLHLFAQQPLTLSEPDTLLTIERGMTRNDVVKTIQDRHLVKYDFLLPIWLRIDPKAYAIKAGTYALKPGMTLEQLMDLLRSGQEVEFSVQFIEGTTAKVWLEKLKQMPHLDHQTAQMTPAQIAEHLGIKGSLEGWFYPASYRYRAGSSDLDILARAHKKMQQQLEQAWQSRDPNLPYQSDYELLIMASLIEKETGQHDERAKVASVFMNRLKKGMRLQTDPTVIYGMGERYDGKITRHDLQEATPYNTYQIDGLPPTPITMPSQASLDAAAHPAQTNYLYFVANGKGGHTFTTNLADHNKAVQVYRQTLKQQTTERK